MSLLRISSSTFARATRSHVQTRGLHVENTVNNVRTTSLVLLHARWPDDLLIFVQNFPFKYHNKKPFVAKLLAFTGVSFGVPFAAVEFKKYIVNDSDLDYHTNAIY